MVSGITGIIIHIVEIYDPTNITNLVAFPYQRSLTPSVFLTCEKQKMGMLA